MPAGLFAAVFDQTEPEPPLAGVAAATMRHNLPSIETEVAAFAEALGWGKLAPAEFPDRLAALAASIVLTRVRQSAAIPETALAELAREVVANRRLMDPNPRAVTEADAEEIYRRTLHCSQSRRLHQGSSGVG